MLDDVNEHSTMTVLQLNYEDLDTPVESHSMSAEQAIPYNYDLPTPPIDQMSTEVYTFIETAE
jgi:hypothetical protein